jgi:aminomethyltransferase
MDAGKGVGLKPCGLGARDTTRLEAGLCLYGNDLTEEITPLEARLDFVVKLDKEKFIGKEVLLKQKSSGLKRARIGLRMLEPGVPRQGYKILADGKGVGFVTSGTFSPLLNVGIAMGYAPPELKAGEKVSVQIHGRPRLAEVVNLPVYDTTRYGRARR